VRVRAWHRALGLDPAATPEFTHSVGQASFTPDGRHLLVTTKANTNEILTYGVGPFGPSARPVRNAEPDAVPFALAFDRFGHVVVAEAGPNAAATFDLGRDGRLTALSAQATGGRGTCWITGVNGTFYLSNAGSATITAVRTGPDGRLRNLGSTSTTGAGTIDTAASGDGRMLYAQTGGGTDAVEAFRIGDDGTLTPAGSVTVPDGLNSEGIAAS
jgi:6-phosphogluconolactonase (cycloisomerase 2 family)